MISALILVIVGWSGLYFLLTTTLPTVGPRWLFFFLLTLAVTGTALPFAWLLNRRFGGPHQASPGVMLRQGLLVGLYAGILMWLQINRSLSFSLALLVGFGMVAFEWFLRLLERSAWRVDQ